MTAFPLTIPRVRMPRPARRTVGRHRSQSQRRTTRTLLASAIAYTRRLFANAGNAPSLSWFDCETLRLFSLMNKPAEQEPVPTALVGDCFAAVRNLAATGPAGLRAALAWSYELTEAIGAVVFAAEARAAGRWVG